MIAELGEFRCNRATESSKADDGEASVPFECHCAGILLRSPVIRELVRI